MTEFVAYRKFTDIDSAEEICDRLREKEIECNLQDNLHQYVKIIGYNEIDLGITLNIKSEDFPKADRILEAYYLTEIENVDKDYHLFEFTDEELKDILAHPYEWGSFDFQLARKLLKEKGIEYSDDYISQRKLEKITELSQVKKVPKYKIVSGYILSIIFPPVGLITGLLIINNRNILPTGEKFYIHPKSDRTHGKMMIGISIIWATLVVFRLI